MSSVAGSMVVAIERAWAGLRAQHADIPDVVVTMAAGSMGRRGVRLGQFGPEKWMHAGAWMPELFVGGEGFAHGPREVLATLLHEAGHGIARTRGIKDTSRGGAYHNGRYRDLATELGLVVERQAGRGWCATTLPEQTAVRFQREVDIIGAALVAHRRSEHDHHADTGNADAGAEDDADSEDGELEGGRSPRNGYSLTCGCSPARRVRAHRRTIAAGPILCGVCTQPFTAADHTGPGAPGRQEDGTKAA